MKKAIQLSNHTPLTIQLSNHTPLQVQLGLNSLGVKSLKQLTQQVGLQQGINILMGLTVKWGISYSRTLL